MLKGEALKLLLKHLKYTATSAVLSDLVSSAVMGGGRKGEDFEVFAYLLLTLIYPFVEKDE